MKLKPDDRVYEFTPRPEITVYELALAISVMTSYTAFRRDLIEKLPDNVKVHFQKIEGRE
jgi:hypothetical protein